MSKKQTTTIIAIVVLVIILGGGFFAAGKFLKKDTGEAETTPTPPPVMEKLKEGVEVSLAALPGKKEVILSIVGMEGRYSGVEYELSYNTNKGPKGTLSGSKPIKLQSGQDEFSREITLGTCSRNVCTYDEGVEKITVVIKLYKNDDTAEFFKEDFEI